LGFPDTTLTHGQGPIALTTHRTGIHTAGYPHGIVAECHLAEPDAGDVLDRHLQYANVRGIRDFGSGDYPVNPAWQAGVKELARRNLVSCLDTRLAKFPQLLALAAKASEVVICVDHSAMPELRTDEFFQSWKLGMKQLAQTPNVWMKISGLGMTDHRWTVKSLEPWVLTAIEAFGTDRVVFGSNWPVDRLYSSYPDLINAYAETIAGFSETEQRAMFAGNAERLFRI
jgi:predicted TIM-barrel fold metal-dependent hydrolase